MKKRIVLLAIVIFALLLIIGLIWFISNSTGNIQVSVTAPANKSDASSYIYQISFGGIPNISGKKGKQIEQVNNDLTVLYDEFRNVQQKPYYVEAKYENIDGKTVITFKGEVTDKESGELIPYEKVLSYDFVITENIISNGNDSLKYFN
jgi:hypothetical protein